MNSALSGMRGNIPGIAWPPAIEGQAAVLAALVGQLEDSQWAPAEELEKGQFRQLARLAEYCARHSKQFAARLERAGLKPDDLSERAGLARLPVLTRREVQAAGLDFFCREAPRSHGPVGEHKTSGSTGEPVTVRKNVLCNLFWSAMAMREHFWHRRDFGKRLCSIRPTTAEPRRLDDWGAPASLLYSTGPSLNLPIDRSAEQLTAWVADFKPDNLLIYPSTLEAFGAYCREHGVLLPELRHIRTIGETLSPRMREEARAAFGAPVEDLYSSSEAGYIAAQCPESGLYHVMAEDVLVEVLNEKGVRCGPGEIGRVTLTSLHNFATPLVRYDVGDYAEVAPPCPCGRGLPALARILGRERNLILMPDGTRHWPLGGLKDARDIVPLNQWQMIQTSRESIEVRLVTERALAPEEEDRLRALMRTTLGYPFALDLKYFSGRLPHGPNGKFEEFICRAS